MIHGSMRLKFTLLFLLPLALFSVSAQSKHFIDTWGGVGYSSLYHNIENTKVSGGVGYSLGVGYEYNSNKFILSTGTEFMHLNSTTQLNSHIEPKEYLYPYSIPGFSGDYYISYLYTISGHKEKHSFGYLNIPLQFGLKFDRYYALLGAKIGLNLFATYKATANIETEGDDPMLIGIITDIPSHQFGEKPYETKGKLNLGLNVTPGVEFGLYLDKWLPQNLKQVNNRSISYRAGVFCDYGLVNLNTSNPKSDNLLINDPPSLGKFENTQYDFVDPQDISLNNLSDSRLAIDKRFGSLFAGIRLTVLFDMTKQKARPKSKGKATQQQLLIPFYARAIDVETKENIDAEISLRYTSGNRLIFSQKTNADGLVSYKELRKGRYTIVANSEGYLNYRKTIAHNKPDTLILELQRRYELFVRVKDAETGENLQASVAINSAQDNKQVINKNTDANGLFGSELNKGKYNLNVNAEGYIYYQKTIEHSATDTIHVALQAVKKDTRIILRNLSFEFNSSVIKPESEPVIEELYQFLTNNPEVRIQIVGHTDNVGTDEYNKNLSNNRAKAVHDAIVEKGIASDRLTWEGRGAADPITTNDTEEGRAENRRVEFVIL